MWALSRLRVRCFYILTTKSGDEGNTYRAVFLGKERFYSFRIQLSKSFSKNYLPYQSSISFRLRSSPFCFPSAKWEKRDKRIGMRQKIWKSKTFGSKNVNLFDTVSSERAVNNRIPMVSFRTQNVNLKTVARFCG